IIFCGDSRIQYVKTLPYALHLRILKSLPLSHYCWLCPKALHWSVIPTVPFLAHGTPIAKHPLIIV
ncbi:hypothetical protein, partial [Brevibacillus agri]|uniref:hypothetical protein n=1 Tax=Brevibacillus agri TaxID=51101 RepID=UPI003D196F28